MAEVRRARAAFALHDADGRALSQGEGEARLEDDALSVGDVVLSWLDADHVTVADYRITIERWPAGRLVLTQLGRRFDTFGAELRRCREAARVVGLGMHGTAMPVVFSGALLADGAEGPADFQVYDTHVTIVPVDGDPFQVPLGTLSRIAVRDDPPAIALETAGGSTVASQLGRRRDAFARAVGEHRDAQATLLARLTGQSGFADGLGLPRSQVRGFDDLLRRFTASDRLEGAGSIIAKARGGEPRVGFVKLLDPESDASAAPEPMPEHWASFLLVPVGERVVLEVLAGPKAATYILRADVDAVNADLQQLHFRRAALALTDQQTELTPTNPHRLALRRLEPLRRLRAATTGRLIHNDGWASSLEQALS